MPAFSRNLKQTLDRALASARERRHEYATLEHLLLSLIDDSDASAVLRACTVDLELLTKNLRDYIDRELTNLINDDAEECKPTAGFQRVVQRAIIIVNPRGERMSPAPMSWLPFSQNGKATPSIFCKSRT